MRFIRTSHSRTIRPVVKDSPVLRCRVLSQERERERERVPHTFKQYD